VLYQTDFVAKDLQHPHASGKSSGSECRAFTLLTSVCWDWYYALHGWPQSPTADWVRHTLKKLIEREYSLSSVLAR